MKKLYFALVASDEELADDCPPAAIHLENSIVLSPIIRVELTEDAKEKIKLLVEQMYNAV